MTGEEKLEKVFQYINRKADFGNTLSVGNARRAAQFAYGAGRESVVESAMESIPEFKWRGVHHPDKDFVAAYPCDCRYLIEFTRRGHLLFYNRQFIASFASLSQAKQAANEDYKQRIKQALGL